MRLSLLFRREPFKDIFKRTVETFLLQIYKKEFNVSWHKKGTPNPHGSISVLYVNKYLNFVASNRVQESYFAPIIKEYSHSNRKVLRPLQKLYVKLAVSRKFREILSHCKVIIEPELPDESYWVFMGGNSQIRILDESKGVSYVLLKDGVNPEIFEHQLVLRSSNYIPALPEILDYSKDCLWYKEMLISAIPINRIQKKGIRDKAVNEAMSILTNLYMRTSIRVDAELYYDKLVNNIVTIAIKRKLNRADTIISSLKLLGEIVHKRLAGTGSDLCLVQTHGDLQDANVLVSEPYKLWLIDWEFTNLRIWPYDLLTYELDFRKPKGVHLRINSFLNAEINKYGTNPISENYTKSDILWKEKNLLCIYLILEELLLRCEQLDYSPQIGIEEGFAVFIEEFLKCTELLAGIK